MSQKTTTNDNAKSQLDRCTFVKIVLMLAVILYHSCLFMTDGWAPFNSASKSPILLYLANWLSSFHIYAFVLVSGYIFYYIKNEMGGYSKLSSFVLNKAKRLIVPALFVTVVVLIPVAVFLFRYSFGEIVKRGIVKKSAVFETPKVFPGSATSETARSVAEGGFRSRRELRTYAAAFSICILRYTAGGRPSGLLV